MRKSERGGGESRRAIISSEFLRTNLLEAELVVVERFGYSKRPSIKNEHLRAIKRLDYQLLLPNSRAITGASSARS